MWGSPSNKHYDFPRLALARAIDDSGQTARARACRAGRSNARYVDRNGLRRRLPMASGSGVAATALAAHCATADFDRGRAENVFRSGGRLRRARASYPYADAAIGVSLGGFPPSWPRLCHVPNDRIPHHYNPVRCPNNPRQRTGSSRPSWLNHPERRDRLRWSPHDHERLLHLSRWPFTRLVVDAPRAFRARQAVSI